MKFAPADEMLDEICRIFDAIGRDELNAVLTTGKRHYKCITVNGECVDPADSKNGTSL
jgi:hypothetical protein